MSFRNLFRPRILDVPVAPAPVLPPKRPLFDFGSFVFDDEVLKPSTLLTEMLDKIVREHSEKAAAYEATLPRIPGYKLVRQMQWSEDLTFNSDELHVRYVYEYVRVDQPVAQHLLVHPEDMP